MVLTASLAHGRAVHRLHGTVSFGAGKKMLPGVLHGAADFAFREISRHRQSCGFGVPDGPAAGGAVLRGALAISLFAKSFKEAQSYLSPLMIVVVLPAVAPSARGGTECPLALVPVLNTSLVSKEIVTGTYHWGLHRADLFSSSVYAAAAIAIAVKLFQREDVLFRT